MFNFKMGDQNRDKIGGQKMQLSLFFWPLV
jgi:hypothetical protein